MKLIATILVCLGLLVAAQDDCPGEYILIGSHCYWISNDEYSWDDGRDQCTTYQPDHRSAGLAHIDDCKELGEVWRYIVENEDPREDYWIGGSDEAEEGVYRWHSTGHEVPRGIPFWFPGQPDGAAEENALSLSKTGYFADEAASIPQRIICQLL